MDQTGKAYQYERIRKKRIVCNHKHHLPSREVTNRLPYMAAPAPFGARSFYHARRVLSICVMPPLRAAFFVINAASGLGDNEVAVNLAATVRAFRYIVGNLIVCPILIIGRETDL